MEFGCFSSGLEIDRPLVSCGRDFGAATWATWPSDTRTSLGSGSFNVGGGGRKCGGKLGEREGSDCGNVVSVVCVRGCGFASVSGGGDD